MKIARIETFLFDPGVAKNLLFVRLETEDGIHGWGEAYVSPGKEPVIQDVYTMDAGEVSTNWALSARPGALTTDWQATSKLGPRLEQWDRWLHDKDRDTRLVVDAIERIGPLGELARDPVAKRRRVGQFVQAAPVMRAGVRSATGRRYGHAHR